MRRAWSVTSDFCITLPFTIAVVKCRNQSKLGEVILELIMMETWEHGGKQQEQKASSTTNMT